MQIVPGFRTLIVAALIAAPYPAAFADAVWVQQAAPRNLSVYVTQAPSQARRRLPPSQAQAQAAARQRARAARQRAARTQSGSQRAEQVVSARRDFILDFGTTTSDPDRLPSVREGVRISAPQP